MLLIKYLRGKDMSKSMIVSIAFLLVFGLTASIAGAANYFEKGLQVIDSLYDDTVFGGRNLSSQRQNLIITFTPGNILDIAAPHDPVDGYYAVIVDTDNDGSFIDEPNSSYIESGVAKNNESKTITWNIDSKLSSLPDGDYRVGAIIFNANNADWGKDWDSDSERCTIDKTLTVTDVTANPIIFSPNGDGVIDTTLIYYTLSESLSRSNSEVTVTIGESGGTKQLNPPAKPTAGTASGVNTVIWNGKDGVGRYAEDGDYQVKIFAKDAGGNEVSITSLLVKVRTKEPEVLSTTPAVDSFAGTITEVKAQLKDNSGQGLDLEKSTIKLLDPASKEVAGTQSNDGINTVKLKVTAILPGDGSKDGKYTMVVTAVDLTGNSKTTNHSFFFDTVFPKIVSITPVNSAVLTSPPASIVIVLNDGTGSGNDLTTTANSVKIDNGSTGGTTIHNGVDTITFTPFLPFIKGVHTIDITPTDLAGNKPNQAIRYQFSYFENATDVLPEIVSTEPSANSFQKLIDKVAATLKDNSGKGLDLKASTIRLEKSGTQIAGTQTDDGNQKITWTVIDQIPTDGSADGIYTIKVKAVDLAGGIKEESFNFLYDTNVPSITSITPTDGSVVITTLSEIVAKVSDNGGSGVNFGQCSLKLKVNNQEVPNIVRSDNAVDTLIFRFPPLETTGEYRVELTLVDRAGNARTYLSKFNYGGDDEEILPKLLSTDPIDRSFKNVISKVSATIKDNSTKGLDFAKTTIRLLNPNDVEIAGYQTNDNNQTVTWNLNNPLPSDGSADGDYKIEIKATDKSNGESEYTTTFTYDTIVPIMTSITPADGSVITTSLSEIIVKVSDAGSGMDFASSRASLNLKLGNQTITNIIRTDNGTDTMNFRFPALKENGKYDISLTLKDRAGNEHPYDVEFDFGKAEDTLPEVLSTDPVNKSFKNAISKVTGTIRDNSTKGLDFEDSTIRLFSPDNVEVAGYQTDDNSQVVTWNLDNPLPTDGSADGIYTINVKAVDKSGGEKEYTSTFVYDTIVPVMGSIVPSDKSVVTASLSQIVVKVSDAGSGIDFASSRASLNLKLGNQAIAGIIRTDNGADTMTFRFPELTENGKYTIELNIKDRAGNEHPYVVEFDFGKAEDTLPEVLSTDPVNKSFKNAISKVTGTIRDNSTKGLDFEDSTIRLFSPNNAEVAGYQTDDNSQMVTWNLDNPLPTDGSADGVYTINVKAVDKSGGEKEYTSTFIYDTIVPVMASIVPSDKSVVTASLSQIVVKVSDVGSGIDFASSRASLKLKLNNQEISVIRSDNGADTMTFRFPVLEDTGKYTIELTLKDRSGNEHPYMVQFDYAGKTEDVLPDVVSTDPSDRSYKNAIGKVSATLKDNSSKGIDFDSTTISLLDPSGVVIAGYQTDDDNQTVNYEISAPLPTDGSADGVYTIKVKVVDKTGGTSEYTATFTYDTLIPLLVSITPSNGDILTQPITQVIAKVSDGNGGGIDFATSRDSMKLNGITSISRQDNGIDTMTFGFAELSDFGKYTIELKLKDKAGNEFTYQSEFDYVRKTSEALPEVVSTDPIDKSFTNSVTKVTAVLKDNSGKGIDFDLSVIRLEDPQGLLVDGRQTDNDSNTLNWELANPLPTDGTKDGTYTIKIKSVDNTGATLDYNGTFLYDSKAPSVVKTIPASNASLTEDINQVVVQLSDGEGSGVDLKATDIKLIGPANIQVQTNRSDGSDNTVTLTFSKLADTGTYTIQVTPKDRAGNTGYMLTFRFSYVLKAPAVKSVSLTNRAYISELTNIEAVLEDRSGVGLDLSETGSSIVVKNPSGQTLQGDQVAVGNDTIVWTSVHTLAKDGTDDGTYTVTVTPVDSLGTSGLSRQYMLIYDTQLPEVDSVSPVDKNANVTYVGQQLMSVQASLKDVGTSGLDIKDQKIYLENSAGEQVPGTQTGYESVVKVNNQDVTLSTVTWNLNAPLARNGSNDGIYSVVVSAKDRAGNQIDFRYPMVYDTIPPQVTAVSPKDDSITNTSVTSVTVTLADSGDGKIDFNASKVELQNPSGSSISGVMSNNGVDTITLKFPSLEDSGTHTVLITAVDKAGNGAGNIYRTRFVFKTGLPVVVATNPVTNPSEKAYVNSPISVVSATIQETDGGGIDFSPTGSEIKLKGPDGLIVIGSQSNDGQRILRYTLGKSLAGDGSDDGRYTILVTTVNKAKRRDQEKSFSFTYDTQAPKLISASPPLDINATLSYVSTSITSLYVRLRDEGPAGIDLDKSTMKLTGPDNTTITGTASNDEVDKLQIDFPSGLPIEGQYTLAVVATDKAGNTFPTAISFVYGISVPKVVSTEPVTMPASEAYVRKQIKEVRATLNETGTSGIDFSSTGSTIGLVGPKSDVPGIQTNDGKNILIFTLTKPLAVNGSDDGVYTISVTPVNSAKLKGQKLDFTFTYDTVSPKVNSNDITIWYSSGAGSSLVEVSAKITDETPSSGFDWTNVDNSWMNLRDSGGKDIPGKVYTNEAESTLRFVLETPLASNGRDDGFYTVIVTPMDRGGNVPDPAAQYDFLYDTKPPKLNRSEITINDQPLLLDSTSEAFPTSVNTKNGVTIVAKMSDDGVGVDLTKSAINITDPKGNAVVGSLKQDGVETIWFTTGMLNEEGYYKVEINPVDLDQNGGSKSSETVFSEFLFELGKPEARITEPGVGAADTESEDKPITIKGTSVDPSSQEGVPTSGVAKVELGGTGPGGKELEWIEVIDDEKAREINDPEFSKWYVSFLPDMSGTYKIKLRVWDKAGNSEIYDTKLELKFTISLSFQGRAYCWPNPVTNGVAHISFEVNTPDSQDVPITLYIYDVSGDLVYEERREGYSTKTRQQFDWECRNSSGEKVQTGIYIFRLKAELPNGDQIAYRVGKPMIIKN